MPLALPPDSALAPGPLLDGSVPAGAPSAAGTELTGIVHAVTTRMDVFNGYLGVFLVAFLVSLFATPLMRRLAVNHGIIDRPNEARKTHRYPIAYLGGAGVYLGILAAILFSYTAPLHGLIEFHKTKFAPLGDTPPPVPFSVLLGMTVITLTGLIDDVLKISPRVKIAGQLVAAAAMAAEDVGVKVAQQLLAPIGEWIGNPGLVWHIPLGPAGTIPVDVVYWTGTAIIALFVLGACNASNLIDGLDGLLSGATSICAFCLLIVALGLAVTDDGPLDSARVILCLALLGGCLGFLPHNFNPASIFLGDCGSLLLGYCTIAIILTLGDTGKTQLVLAGLMIYAVPIIDTTLAIFRRKMSGKKISDADDQHLHHMLRRALGVKGAVLVIYAMGISFGVVGIWLTEGRARITYTIAIVMVSFIGMTAFKIARRKQIEEQAAAFDRRGGTLAVDGLPASPAIPVAANGEPAPAPRP
jgi:UDP-GlcNAc:undecaprenyl-phosphate GlcNAc-1-phosphate transferase